MGGENGQTRQQNKLEPQQERARQNYGTIKPRGSGT